jgi:hypothetical protein
MSVSSGLNPLAAHMEQQPDAWQSFLLGTFVPLSNPIPAPIQRAIASAARAQGIPPSVSQELHEAMRTPFSFQEFEHCRRHLASGKSPGPSGLTTTQVKHWGPETAAIVFELSQIIMWRHHHVPQWWQDRLMTFLPKEPGHHDLAKIRQS